MRVVIFGASGQLGTDLQAVVPHDVVPLSHAEVDITDADAVRNTLERVQPDCAINAAAWNQVDLAEDEPDSAWAGNALGPRNLALGCAARGNVLVHVSTDYVFGHQTNGDRGWTETDVPGPVSLYGTTKLAGEHLVRSNCPRHFVVRTCGLYGHAARSGFGKGNFVETMLRLAGERDELRIVNDQHCTPTSSLDLARAIADLVETSEFGLYHCTNRGATTWCDFAKEIFRHEQIETRVIPIPTSEYPTRARRPASSVLDCQRIETVIHRPMPDWQQALGEYLDSRRHSRF